MLFFKLFHHEVSWNTGSVLDLNVAHSYRVVFRKVILNRRLAHHEAHMRIHFIVLVLSIPTRHHPYLIKLEGIEGLWAKLEVADCRWIKRPSKDPNFDWLRVTRDIDDVQYVFSFILFKLIDHRRLVEQDCIIKLLTLSWLRCSGNFNFWTIRFRELICHS